MLFTCAKPGCGKEFVKLGGWKRHMSKMHGGYDDADIAEVTTGGGASTEDDVRQRMEVFAASLDEPKEATGAVEQPSTTAQNGQAPPPVPTVKTVKASPKKLKRIMASIPQALLENTGIALDDEDREALDEAGEFISDIFAVEFEVPQEKRVLHSRFWAIAWVGGVALLIYCKHRFADLWAKVYETYKKRVEEAQKKDV